MSMTKKLETTANSLRKRGFQVQIFPNKGEAANYLVNAVKNTTVGFGGSVTLEQMGLYQRLGENNRIIWHWQPSGDVKDARAAAMTTDVYFTSANGLAETGEIINIDGAGNRVASTLFGHKKVYFVIGRNKIAPTYEDALWHARNVAAPKNAQRLQRKTPCAIKGDRCYDCSSPERICRGLVVLWEPMLGTEMEVLLVDEDLGY